MFTGRHILVGGLPLALLLGSCKREERQFEVPAAEAVPATQSTQSTALHTKPADLPALPDAQQQAYAISQGKQLFQAMNCSGCHANGGGDKGPPLMDHKWLYGSSAQDIYTSIVQGRPNGMPSFAGRLPDYQVWQIVAYVRSMSVQVPRQAAPGRDDHMNTGTPENSRGRLTPTSEPAHFPPEAPK